MAPKNASSVTKRKAEEGEAPVSSGPKRPRKDKDPKASHLYTDDNPETTLHGTGFKDKATALHTIDLVSQRSLTYQFQTVNTMLYRAKGHKYKTPGIEDAIQIFQEWTDGYKKRKGELRKFPLLSKPKVQNYLKLFEEGEYGEAGKEEEGIQDAQAFSRLYVEMRPRKRLANTLVDNEHPEREDWEVRRYKKLCEMVEQDKSKWDVGELWIDERGRIPTAWHLKAILWAWSPSAKT